MRKLLIVVGCLLAAFAFAPPAQAVPVIDFTQGGAGVGGLITLWSDGNLSGSDIPIANITIANSPMNTGVFDVESALGGGFGTLSFSTGGMAGPSSIMVTGCVPSGSPEIVPCPATDPLLSGTITGFSVASNAEGLVAAFGTDEKSATLLANLGLTGTQWGFFGFSLVTNTLTIGKSSDAISTDIKNTAVPEPGSMLLLGTGLLGLASVVRRRPRK